jgi:hypothetical protein
LDYNQYICGKENSEAEMVDYIFKYVNVLNTNINKDDFVMFLENGDCLLLMDGLDEIEPQNIERFNYHLHSFFNYYDKNSFVVTTRPYPTYKLDALNKIEVLELQPLSYWQSRELIRNLEKQCEVDIKRTKLSSIIDYELFSQHQSFMQNPMLLTVILQVYIRLGVIPDSIHILYREIVKCLTELYDAESKNSNRMLKSRLPVKKAVSLFASLCYLAYVNGEYGFTEQKIDLYLRKSRVDVDFSDFLFDICENLCFLEANGNSFRFHHRSMQEFFCASHLEQLPIEKWKSVIALFPNQTQDYSGSLLRFLYEMRQDLVEEYIFLPSLTEFLGDKEREAGYIDYLLNQYPVIRYSHNETLYKQCNEPLAPVPFQTFLLDMIGVVYKYTEDDFRVHREFIDYVTLTPLAAFGYDPDGVYEGVLKYIPYSEYDRDKEDGKFMMSSFNLKFSVTEVLAAYRNDKKYDDIIKLLMNDKFIFKAEYLTLFNYYNKLKTKFAQQS